MFEASLLGAHTRSHKAVSLGDRLLVVGGISEKGPSSSTHSHKDDLVNTLTFSGASASGTLTLTWSNQDMPEGDTQPKRECDESTRL